jgi:hypothetical protein
VVGYKFKKKLLSWIKYINYGEACRWLQEWVGRGYKKDEILKTAWVCDRISTYYEQTFRTIEENIDTEIRVATGIYVCDARDEETKYKKHKFVSCMSCEECWKCFSVGKDFCYIK